jgi:AsmA protein
MKIFIGLGVAALLFVGVILALPFLIDLTQYEDQYKPALEEALNRKIALQGIRLTIWPRLGARVAGFTVLDDPAFGSEPFASLASLDVGIQLRPLLSGRVEIEEITLRDPVITVIKNKKGVLNVATLGRPGVAAPETPSRAPVPSPEGPLKLLGLLAVDRFSIEGGAVTYRDLSPVQPTEYVLQDLDVLLKAVRFGQSPTLHVDMLLQPFNLPLTVDGQMGPLTESLEVKRFDFTFGLGKVAMLLKGSFVGGTLDATLSSPSITTADLPMVLPLTKPVEITDLLLAARVAYPLKAGMSPLEWADVSDLRLGIAMGRSVVSLKGTVLGGQARVTVSSSSINSADLPIALPLAKPVIITDLQVAAMSRKPLKLEAPPLELADVSELHFGVVLGKSVVTVKGSLLGGQASLAASSPSVNTAELPIELPLAKPVEVRNLQLTADLKGQDARLTSLSFAVFNGSARAQAALGLHVVAPPFSSTVTLQGMHLGPALDAFDAIGLSISGTAQANVSVKGQGFSMPELTRALNGTGHLGVKDGRIEGVNLLQEAVTLLKVAGISFDNPNATAFSTIETDLAIQQGVIHVRRLLMDSHDFQATGGGTIGFDQRLNMTLLLHLSQALSQKLVAALPVAKLAMNAGRIRLPLTISGSAQAPSFGLDMKGLSGNAQEQVQKQVEAAVDGLLKGSMKPEGAKKQGQDLLKGLFGR